MKKLVSCLLLALLSRMLVPAAATPAWPLQSVPLDFKKLESAQTHKYQWVSVSQKGTNTETKPYARLTLSSKFKDGKLQIHDTITLAPALKGTVFDRRLNYAKGTLSIPELVTIDVTTEGKKVRQLHYEKGDATIIESSGVTNKAFWVFDDGLLLFNGLLRAVPLLPREVGRSYSFQAYVEPFQFRAHEANRQTGSFLLTCEAAEKITVGRKSHECVRFRLNLRRADIQTVFWVSKDNLIVKFADVLPAGSEASYLEATLQE